jgi:two-component system, NarL family, sensor histidine kinase BarA
MIGSCRQLLTMIEEILTYARTNAPSIDIRPVAFRLEEVVETVRDMNASLLERKSLRFGAELSRPGSPRCGRTGQGGARAGEPDRQRHQVHPECGWVRVGARGAPEPGGGWRSMVADSGIGIDREHHELIFREFAQVDASRARIHHGTGLGLSIARQFVELHGGQHLGGERAGRGEPLLLHPSRGGPVSRRGRSP